MHFEPRSTPFRWARPSLAILFFALCALLATEAMAQDWKGRGRVRGSVKDTTTDKPIKDAQIKILFRGQEGEGPTGITTDKKGRWAFMGLASGEYTVRIAAEGFVPVEAQVRVNEYSPMAMEPVDMEMRPVEATQAAGGAEEQNRLRALIDEGNSKLQGGDPEGARAAYEEVYAELQDDAQKRMLESAIASTYLQAGDAAEARTRLEALLATSTDVAEQGRFLQQIARSYYMEEKIDESVQTLERALALSPDDVTILRRIIDTLVGAGREEAAEPYMARLPEGEKVDVNALLNLGITAYNNNELDTAFEKFTNVLADYPDNPEALYYLGLVTLGQGKSDEAKANLERFLEVAPDHKYAAEAKDFLQYL